MTTDRQSVLARSLRAWLAPFACGFLLMFSAPAHAASEGELCGRGGGWSVACDPGLRCEETWRFGPFRLGTCVASERICGGLADGGCARGEFCDYPLEAICGAADATGVCRPRPQVCTRESRPVCGCDDRTYGNPCEASAAGVSIAAYGVCGECREDEDCLYGVCDRGVTCQAVGVCPPAPPNRCTVCGDGSQLRCRRAPPRCPAGQVPEIVDGCFGACVDRYTCEARSCEYGGEQYEVGERFAADDGCNTCRCGEDGSVMCTLRVCACNYDDPRRIWVSRSAEECTRIDFICQAGRPFVDECGCGCQL